MLKKRIIPCLDIKDGRTVKGVNFIDIRDAGNAVDLARKYSDQGADELVFLDITATIENRKTLFELVEKVAASINIPFTVGGGIKSVKDVSTLISAGADKISINSAAIRENNLISQIASEYGSQCVVLAVDTNYTNNDWYVFLDGGRTPTDIKTLDWVKKAEELGAGEILLTAMTADGTKNGFQLDITEEVSSLVNIPVIASGGAGSCEHFKNLFLQTPASAALAASIFHFNEIQIPELKKYLTNNKINIRWK